jgi:hypothetical protein
MQRFRCLLLSGCYYLSFGVTITGVGVWQTNLADTNATIVPSFFLLATFLSNIIDFSHPLLILMDKLAR